MAQTNYTPISLYYSTTASATPTAGNLVNGELAINITDGKLFYKNDADVISSIENQNTFGTVNVNSTLVVSSSPTDILSIIPGSNIDISADAVNKTITISSTGGETLGSLLTSNTSVNQVLDVYNGTQYRTCKYVIQAMSGTQLHSCEVILTHNDIKTVLSQYGIVKTNRFNLFTLDSDIVSGNVVLYITPANDNTQIDYIRTSIVSRTLPV